jgi:hypothetical protein
MTIVAALLIVIGAVAVGFHLGVAWLLTRFSEADAEATARMATALAKRLRSKWWMKKWPASKP